MLRLKKIAVTGAASSGKSSVCRFFREWGAYTVSADEIVHKLLSPQSITGQKVVELLGQSVIHNNNIDRQRVAERVFNEPALLQKLEEILHPAVYKEMENEYEKAQNSSDCTLFVAEIPLLYETGGEKFFDAVIAMNTPEALCKMRSKSPDYEKRMARQWPAEKKLEMAPYRLNNDGDLETLKKETAKLYQQLI